MRRPLLLTALLLLGGLGPAAAQTATPAETARAMLRQYQEDPARIDRARDLLEAHLARGGPADLPTLLALARAWFLFGEERARAEDDKIAARFTMRGTHQGPFFGVPPTGKTNSTRCCWSRRGAGRDGGS